MKIKELDELFEYKYTPSFEQNVKEQFPNLYKKNYGFAQPAHKLHECLTGVWLNWHRWHDFNKIHEISTVPLTFDVFTITFNILKTYGLL